jgi:hypothetical protein
MITLELSLATLLKVNMLAFNPRQFTKLKDEGKKSQGNNKQTVNKTKIDTILLINQYYICY